MVERLRRATSSPSLKVPIVIDDTLDTNDEDQPPPGSPQADAAQAAEDAATAKAEAKAKAVAAQEDADTADRLQKERVWIVDPIDGTREFLQGFPEYAISVALAVQGNPVLGVVFNPATKETFSSVSPSGNSLANKQTNSTFPENLHAYTVLISRGEHQFREVPPLPGTPTIIPLGSVAYRLALLSAGKADLTLSWHARKEWDVAAGTALCLANGIQVTDFLGEPLKFNQPFPSIRGFLAASPEIHKKIHDFQDLSYR